MPPSLWPLRPVPSLCSADRILDYHALVNFRLAEFTLDADARQLFRNAEEVHLSPKAFDLLLMLIMNRPKAMAKRTLQERLWPATFVSEANLPTLIAEIRGALADRPQAPRFVRTVHRFGYAFCAEVAETSAPLRRPDHGGVRYWLVQGTRKLPLAEGVNTVGRDPDSTVCLESTGVSRRHSSIRIGADGVVLQDLGSKNGTFVSGTRIQTVELHDGDQIRIGHVRLTLRISLPAGPTETEDVGYNRQKLPVKQ
jgi:DNA-binding winged helix-turn-helix (wHTH) protein